MGHAKRWDPTATSRHAEGVRHVEDVDPIGYEHTTQRILQMTIRAIGGDPVAGIRNAVIVGTIVWIALALASAFFFAH
jgi:hypothetical protein